MGLYGAVGNRMTALEVAQLAGDAAEITHQHPLGFLPASLLAALVYKVVPQTPQYVQENMDTIVEEVLALLDEVYKGEYEASKNDLRQMSLKAIALAHSNTPDGHLFEETLELSDLILAIADDLSTVGALDKKRYKF